MSQAASASDGAMPGMIRRAHAGPARSAADALRRHWPEYLMEAWGLGVFMVSAGLFATLLWYPGSPAAQAVPDGLLRRALMGLAMGLTATLIIYSPWGQRSGAHINPAVTLTFWRLGKVATWDAVFYIVAQFAGGLIGVWLVLAGFGLAFANPPVAYVATVPGPGGVWVALGAEALISFGLMAMVLFATNTPRLMRLHRRVRGLPGGALHHPRGAGLGHEHEPRANLRLSPAGRPLDRPLDLLRRAAARHAARGRRSTGRSGARQA